jgi:uncharacterized membrane protein
MDELYSTYKFIHLFGMAIFLGNIIVTGYWKIFADMTGDGAIIAYSQRMVTHTDYLFTLGGVLLVIAGAYGMVYESDSAYLDQQWLLQGSWYFALSGIIWVVILLPVQYIQAKMARDMKHGSPIPDSYKRLGLCWKIFGTIATLLPIISLYLMIMRPE